MRDQKLTERYGSFLIRIITILQNGDNGSKIRILLLGFVSRFRVLSIAWYNNGYIANFNDYIAINITCKKRYWYQVKKLTVISCFTTDCETVAQWIMSYSSPCYEDTVITHTSWHPGSSPDIKGVPLRFGLCSAVQFIKRFRNLFSYYSEYVCLDIVCLLF